MNCDQVFDVLTRGPFPSGTSIDANVELHLAACHDCRQLADALRPAVDMFHEAMPHDEHDDLPGYRGSLRETETRSLPSAIAAMLDRPSAEASTSRLSKSSVGWLSEAVLRRCRPRRANVQDRKPYGTSTICERRRKVTSETSPWRLTAACLLVLVLAGVFWTVNSNSHNDWAFKESHEPRPEQFEFQPDADGLLHLAKLELSDKCVPRHHRGQLGTTTSPGDANSDVVQAPRFACCTQCHHAASSRSQPSRPQTISVAMAACTACHE